MNETIGVVIATYNGEKYIEQQLQSIVFQSKVPNLIVLSDGGSTDCTLDIARNTLCSSGIEYKIFESEVRLDVVNNFEKALRECNTDIIFFSDQDDVWDYEKIETTARFLKDNDACLAFTDAFITDDDLKKRNINLWTSVGYKQTEDFVVYKKGDNQLKEELIKHNIITGMTMCITAGLKEAILPLSKYDLHDKWTALVAVYYGSIIAVNKRLVLYRQHASNSIGTDFNAFSSLKKGINYKNTIVNRQKMIKDLDERISTIMQTKHQELGEYYDYLDTRVAYMEKRFGLTHILKILRQYKRYERYPSRIIFRDVYYRCFYGR